MGLFDKFKSIFSTNKQEKEEVEDLIKDLKKALEDGDIDKIKEEKEKLKRIFLRHKHIFPHHIITH